MSTYAKPEHHVVTVRTSTEGGTDEGEVWTDLESVEFSCGAPYDGPCRTYPKCDCEQFIEDDDHPGHDQYGHPYVTGRDCWVKTWFDAQTLGESTIYAGADRTDRTDCGVPLVSQHGHVDIVGYAEDTGPEWEWSGEPVRDETDPDRIPSTVLDVIPGQTVINIGGDR